MKKLFVVQFWSGDGGQLGVFEAESGGSGVGDWDS